jgi:hypothetical protein
MGMSRTVMTHLQRWKSTLERQNYDRLPRFYSATGEFTESLKNHLVSDLDTILYEKFDIDYRFRF